MSVEVRLREWSTLGPNEPSGACLRGRRLNSTSARQLAALLQQKRRLEIEEVAGGLRIRTLSFVGRVQVDDLIITVEPKLRGDDLLLMLRYAYGLADLHAHGTTAIGDHGALLQDLLAKQLLSEAASIWERGLHRRYVERSEQLASPRGRIAFAALARSATVSTSLPCLHAQRLADNVLNQALGAGLERAADLAVSPSLRVSLRRLASHLREEVSSAPLSKSLLDRARRHMSRLSSHYAPALKLIELLLEGRSASLASGEHIHVPGFLFDMNRFFQELVGRFLDANLPAHEVRDQHTLKDMMSYRSGKNPRLRRPPKPRPDFAVFEQGHLVTILDAKYRDLWEHTLPDEMLYQLAVYALASEGSGSAAIIYPTISREATEATIDVRGFGGDARTAWVSLRPLVVPELAELLRAPERSVERRAMARRLALGEE